MSQSPMQCEKRLYATRVIVHSECRGGNSVERQRPESKEEQKTENWGKAVRSVKVVALDTPVSHHVYSGLRVHLVLCCRVHMSSSGGGSSRFDCGNSHRRISLPAGKKGKDPAGFVVVLFELRQYQTTHGSLVAIELRDISLYHGALAISADSLKTNLSSLAS